MNDSRPILAPRAATRAELCATLAIALLQAEERELDLLRRHAAAEPGAPPWHAPGLSTPRAALLQQLAEGGPAEAQRQRAAELGLRLVAWHDVAYPAPLFDLLGPPALLYVRGELPADPPPRPAAITIVGARTSTARGRAFAAELGAEVARRGGITVSGLAIGIDQAAHVGALGGGGTSVAVLACGLDRIYPPGAEPLARRLAATGAVISEMALGTPPHRHQFPRRNRILAAWSQATLVVEADLESGSLITASRALELGRTVLAMPGPIDAPTSRGTNRLIRDGAHPLLEHGDLDLLLPQPAQNSATAGDGASDATREASRERLLALLATPRAAGDLAERSGIAVPALLLRLVELELEGRVTRRAGGLWARA